jgi:hypothetical protein
VLAALAILVPVVELGVVLALGRATPFNDFNDYYFAAALVRDGVSPYDNVALAAKAADLGVAFTVGTGYSYPLPFAVAMLPFTALSPWIAAWVFTAVSLVVFGIVVAVVLGYAMRGASPGILAGLAVLAGAYPPIVGSVFNGQANLLVTSLAAVGVVALVRQAESTAGAAAVAVAAVVKLVPGVVVVPLALARRWRDTIVLASVAAVSLALASLAAPFATRGAARLTALLDPDPYFTNQSLNGFVSRLVMSSDRTVAPFPGAFDPLPVAGAIAIAFVAVNLLLLWRARERLQSRAGLPAAIALAIVAATIVAPKNSFWNHALLLVPAGLLLLDADGRPGRDRVERVLLLVWFGGAVVEQVLWAATPAAAEPVTGLATLGWSSALYGAVAFWLVFVRRVLFVEAS